MTHEYREWMHIIHYNVLLNEADDDGLSILEKFIIVLAISIRFKSYNLFLMGVLSLEKMSLLSIE